MLTTIKERFAQLQALFTSESTYQPYRLSEQLPSFQTLLPWRHYDTTRRLFINTHSMGFGLELPLLCGANEETVERFNDLIKKLPEGDTDIQFTLCCHNQFAVPLHHQRQQLAQQGGLFAAMADIAYRFETLGATKGYCIGQGQPVGYLRDMRLFLFVSQPTQAYSDKKAYQLCDVRDNIESQLRKFNPRRLNDQDFLNTVFPLTSPDTITGEPVLKKPVADQPLHEQSMAQNYTLCHDKTGLDIAWEKSNGQMIPTRLVTLNVNQWPKEFALWQSPDNFAALLDSSESIPCPFVLTFLFRVMNQEKARSQATQRHIRFSNQAASPMLKWIPSLAETAADWEKLRHELEGNRVKVVRAYYGVTLYTDRESEKEAIARTLSVFRKNGFELSRRYYQQMQSFLATLPFMTSEGLYDDLQRFGRLKKLTSFNAANLLPIVGDWKGNPTGMTLTTARNQRFCFDPFSANTDNANILITGTSGSGKSFLTQRLIFSILAQGGWVFVIDVGGSYKKLCQLLGGVYLEGGDLSLNPFTHVVDIAAHSNRIANLLAVMASPRQGLSDIQRSILTDAIESAFAKTAQQTKIDDVVSELMITFENSQNNGQKDQRIHDIATLLKRFCDGNTHGDLFNRPSKLAPDAPFVVLDLDAFKNDKDFMKCVLMALMMMINERAYQSDRNQPKACFLDEAWSMLLGDNDDIKQFIENGYRTIRKHGGLFCTLAQEIETFFANRVAKAVHSSSAIKITLKQNLSNFIEEHPDYFSDYEVRAIDRFESVKDCGYSSMLLDIGGNKVVARLFADAFSKILFTTEPNQFAAVETATKQGQPLEQAVMQVAHHYYPDEMRALGL